MHTLLRTGTITLAAGSLLLTGAIGAQAAPATAVTVTVNRLILAPAEYGHIGSIRIAIRNTTDQPFSGAVAITEPILDTAVEADGASGCLFGRTPDSRTILQCTLDEAIAPGATGFVRVAFQSPAKPQRYAQHAPQQGSVEVGGVVAEFPALFRSTTGSLRNPRPYVQDTVAALSVTAPDVTLTRQEDGTFAGRVPVTIRNNGDAPHRALGTSLALPAGVDEWPFLEGGDTCASGGDLPVPPGGFGIACGVAGGQLAEGQERTITWLLTAPAGTPTSPLDTATTSAVLSDPTADQPDHANIDTFTITVAD